VAKIASGGGPIAKPKIAIRKVTPTRAPVTDVQSSGGDYGTKQATTFKKTAVYKRQVAAAAPARQTDATSSGPGYGHVQAHAYVQHARDSVHSALSGKPFDVAGIKAAQILNIANELRVQPDGSVVHIHHRDILPDRHVVLDPKKGGMASPDKQGAEDFRAQSAGMGAPVLSILNQTARPIHAIAGLATSGTHGFTEGLLHNKPYTFGKVLTKAGVPKGVAGAVGFGLDVGLDPTTYVTGGASSVERAAAEKAALSVTRKAERAGMSEAGVKTVARAAAKKAAASAKPGNGITIKMAGHQVPGVTTGTAAVGRVAKKVAAKAPDKVKTAGAGVRNIAGDVRPQLARAGESQAEHTAVRQVGRQARAEARVGMAQAERHARALKKLVPKDQYENVINAVETNKLGALPAHLQEPARQVRDSLRQAKRVRARAGVTEGDITKATGPGAAVNYFPHALADEVKPGQALHDVGITPQTKGVRKVRLSSSKSRTDLRPIGVQNPERLAGGESAFSTNLPLVHGEYMAGTAKAVAAKNLAKRLADIGRPVIADRNGDVALKDGEAIFHYHDVGGQRELTQLDGSAIPKSTGAGRYVILDKRTVEREFANIAPQTDRTATGMAFDRSQAAFKRIATMTPGFHARNLVGDAQMGYLAQPGHRMPVNVAQAGRAVRRLNKVEVTESKTLRPVALTDATIKVAGKPRNVDDFLAEAQKQGVIRSGYIGRELREQGKGMGRTTRIGGKATAAGHRVNRWMQNREDLMRLATYKHGLDSGLKPSEAADLSLNTHIDYGDLTKLERTTMRRVAPFYTFSARALPIHAKALVTKPGKFANIEKAREEASLATGLNLQQDQNNLKGYEARQAPFILKLGGVKTVLSDSLPLTLLNEIPTKADAGAYLSELSQFAAGMLSPIIKDPAELYANRSFFFRSDIQNQQRPLVAAPDWVSAIYKNDRGLAKKLGITPDYFDKKTGRKVWGWNGKSDYFAKAIPGLPNLLQQLTTSGTNRRGQGEVAKIIGGLTGVKAQPLDPAGAMIEALYPKLNQVTAQMGALNQQGVKAANATAEYRRLALEQKDIKATITKLSGQRGDKVPLYTTGKKKAVRSVWGGSSSSSSSGWGSPATSAKSSSSGWGG
jgi:hypothetical protein